MIRVAGADPGTSSLDLLVLEEAIVADQVRFTPEQLAADPALPVRWLEARGPFDLVAGPSGYGLPLVSAAECTPRQVREMVLPGNGGVAGFSRLVEACVRTALPMIFLPGVIHLPSVPVHRKRDRIDLGTPDKLCVAALALAQGERSFCLVELGSIFTACLVVENGQVVAGVGGTSGPPGLGSGGSWDGEVACLVGGLTKADLFLGGSGSDGDSERLVEGVLTTVAGLHALVTFPRIILSGRLLELLPDLAIEIETALGRVASVIRLAMLPGAWVKHAAQGAALLADGLAGGKYRPLVESLRLREASGSVLDSLRHPAAVRARQRFLAQS